MFPVGCFTGLKSSNSELNVKKLETKFTNDSGELDESCTQQFGGCEAATSFCCSIMMKSSAWLPFNVNPTFTSGGWAIVTAAVYYNTYQPSVPAGGDLPPATDVHSLPLYNERPVAAETQQVAEV